MILQNIKVFAKIMLGLSLVLSLTFCGKDNPADSGNGGDSNIDSTQAGDLVWADEFDENGAPDADKWTYDIGHGTNGWGNNEVQNYTDNTENVRVEDGHLVIEAHKKDGDWTSARIKTQGLKSFKYVTVKVRAKLPKGSGTWPAIWMLGSNITDVGWPACGEVDIMEHVGKDPGVVHSALHTPSSYGNTQNTGTKEVADFNEAFHVYEAEWTSEQITFRIDGEAFYSYNPNEKNDQTWPFNDQFFLIMNIAMGGNWGSDPQYETGGRKNGIDPELTQARMEIDYVRVYRN